MDTHLSTKEIRGYLRRRLTRDDFDRVCEHVHSCASCYQDFLAELQERFPIEIDPDELAGLKGWHLEGEELAAYVEGRMDELSFECASLHLEECGSCMEKASAAFEYRLEHPRLSTNAHLKQSSTWSRHLLGVRSISLPRLQLTAAAVLLLGLALFMWGRLQPSSEKPQVAGVPPPEKHSTDPSPHQPTVPIQPGPVGSDIDHRIDEAAPGQIAANSREQGAGRHEDEIERALIAKNLAMPPTIEMLDRTPALVIRGNRASIQSFTIVRPFTTLINNDRPTFCWTALSGDTSYTVSVYDADLHLVETSEPLEENSVVDA